MENTDTITVVDRNGTEDRIKREVKDLNLNSDNQEPQIIKNNMSNNLFVRYFLFVNICLVTLVGIA